MLVLEGMQAGVSWNLILNKEENFTKFLVNRIGQVVDRFEPDAGTDIVRQAVEIELNR